MVAVYCISLPPPPSCPFGVVLLLGQDHCDGHPFMPQELAQPSLFLPLGGSSVIIHWHGILRRFGQRGTRRPHKSPATKQQKKGINLFGPWVVVVVFVVVVVVRVLVGGVVHVHVVVVVVVVVVLWCCAVVVLCWLWCACAGCGVLVVVCWLWRAGCDVLVVVVLWWCSSSVE